VQIPHHISRLVPKAKQHLKNRKPFFRKRSKEEWGRMARTAAVVVAAMTLAGTLTFVGIVAWFAKDLPDPNNLANRRVAETTKIYDRTGKVVLYEIHGDEKRTSVELADISPHAVHATIAVEDKNFYNHHGFSIRGILRALYKDIRQGSLAEGGSTITQQFIKNSVLSNEKTPTRKLKELVLSLELERRFSKDDILKFYLNEIPYGSVAYGIESASKIYLGKPAKDLSLAESAMLAALPQAPSYYSPYGNHRDALVERSHVVLGLMVAQGYITADEAAAAEKEDVLAKIVPRGDSIIAPHFIFKVKEQLAEMFGEQAVEREGLHVITTLDADLQAAAEQAVKDNAKSLARWGATTAALMAEDAKTGDILAYVGSADYRNDEIDGKSNALGQGFRQPGSSMKPIIYGAAFEKGYTPDTVLIDAPTTFVSGNGTYEPKNYNLKTNGPITMKQALAGSLNIPAVQTVYLTGIGQAVSYAERLGYTTFGDRSRIGLSFALGSNEVRPEEHIGAFAVYANDGSLPKMKSLLTVTDRTGKELFKATDETTPVLAPQVARQVATIMSDNSLRAYVFGTANSLTLPDRPVAAKTGTTNDFKDAWTIGYTPSLVAGVWVGNAKGTNMKQGADGSVIAAPIWNQFMRAATKGKPVENFPAPAPVTTGKAVLDGKLDPRQTVTVDRLSGKLATEFTPEDMREERAFGIPHSILYYIDKDNPQGPPPKNPAADPQFKNWEAAALAWGISQNMIFTEPPTEFDTLHSAEFAPQVQLLMPANNATVSERYLDVGVSATSPRGVRSVTYLIDDTEVATFDQFPFGGTVGIPNNLTQGFHTLTAKAKDDVGNTGSASVTLNLTAAPSDIGIVWSAPSPGQKLSIGAFPHTIRFRIDNPISLAKLSLVAVDPSGEAQVVGAVSNPTLGSFSFNWNRPSRLGRHILRVEVERKDGTAGQDGLIVNVE
jgi:1A family penicillin-binding protein